MATQLECFTCGGSYTADQRRRHEATTKHQNAVIGKAMAGQAAAKGEKKMRSTIVPRPEVDPAAVEAHVAALNAEASQTSEDAPVSAPAPVAQPVRFPAAATGIEALEKAVKRRAADVRWTEKHDPELTDLLASRRERLAEAEAALAAAKE